MPDDMLAPPAAKVGIHVWGQFPCATKRRPAPSSFHRSDFIPFQAICPMVLAVAFPVVTARGGVPPAWSACAARSAEQASAEAGLPSRLRVPIA